MKKENTTNETTNETANETTQTIETPVEEPPKKKRVSRSLGVKLLEADLMVAGITNNPESLTAMGLGEEYLTAFKQFISDLRSLNEEQERLKALQKDKTAALVEKQKELTQRMRHARSTVKVNIPMELWKEFGIKSTR